MITLLFMVLNSDFNRCLYLQGTVKKHSALLLSITSVIDLLSGFFSHHCTSHHIIDITLSIFINELLLGCKERLSAPPERAGVCAEEEIPVGGRERGAQRKDPGAGGRQAGPAD